jgi:hypothetical protein
MEIEDFIEQNKVCYDRFTFDRVFKFLLLQDCSNEEAKDIILFNCSLSAIIFQERIDNEFYKKITIDNEISGDIKIMRNEIFHTVIPKRFSN